VRRRWQYVRVDILSGERWFLMVASFALSIGAGWRAGVPPGADPLYRSIAAAG
jgi:hypothetical protein